MEVPNLSVPILFLATKVLSIKLVLTSEMLVNMMT